MNNINDIVVNILCEKQTIKSLTEHVLALAEVIEDHFYGLDLGNGIVINGTVPPSEDTAGGADPWYGIIVSLEYTHSIT